MSWIMSLLADDPLFLLTGAVLQDPAVICRTGVTGLDKVLRSSDPVIRASFGWHNLDHFVVVWSTSQCVV
jgi:hypothetical protein